MSISAGDLVEVLDRWHRSRRLRDVPAQPIPSHPTRVSSAAGGLLACLVRRGLRHARLRASSSGGRVILGEEDATPLEPSAARAAIAGLREAASLPACSPHAAGSFGARGHVARVEAYACTDGERAFVHVADAAAAVAPLPPALCELAEMDAATLPELRAASVGAEDLLAVRLVATSADAAAVLARHADFTLLALASGHPSAPRFLAALDASLRGLVEGPDWRLAWEPIAECAAWTRGRARVPTQPVRTMLARCRRRASRDARAGLVHAFRGGC